MEAEAEKRKAKKTGGRRGWVRGNFGRWPSRAATPTPDDADADDTDDRQSGHHLDARARNAHGGDEATRRD
jgi:hypothetical protein